MPTPFYLPLHRRTVTVASRIMLPTYVGLFTLIGLAYLFQPAARVQASPALAFADRLIPMPVWGGIFLTTAGLLSAAMLVAHRRRWTRVLAGYALWVGVVVLTTWAGIFTGAVITAGASLGSPVWPAFAAIACFASSRSLAAGER